MTRDPALDAALTDLCRRLGLSPWLAYHRPRLHARIAAQDALMAQVRADAQRVQGGCRHPGEHTKGLRCPDCGKFSAHSWMTRGHHDFEGWNQSWGGTCGTHGKWVDSA